MQQKKMMLAHYTRSHIDTLAKPGGGGELAISPIMLFLSFVGTCNPTITSMSFVPTKYRKEVAVLDCGNARNKSF